MKDIHNWIRTNDSYWTGIKWICTKCGFSHYTHAFDGPNPSMLIERLWVRETCSEHAVQKVLNK